MGLWQLTVGKGVNPEQRAHNQTTAREKAARAEADRLRMTIPVRLPVEIEAWMLRLGLKVPVRIPARAPLGWQPRGRGLPK